MKPTEVKNADILADLPVKQVTARVKLGFHHVIIHMHAASNQLIEGRLRQQLLDVSASRLININGPPDLVDPVEAVRIL